MGAGYSDRRRDDDGLLSSPSLILLVVFFIIIALKGGNRNKHICVFPAVVVVVFIWSLLVPKTPQPQEV